MPTFTRPLSSAVGAPPLLTRPRDPAARDPGARRARGGAARVLADAAIVGDLGRPQIAALGLAGTVLAGAFTIFNFLRYGTAAVVARASGAGRQEEAARLAAQALWVSLAIGVVLLGRAAAPATSRPCISASLLRVCRPLEIVLAAKAADLVLEVPFVYGLGWGIAGSAAGTAIAQTGMGAAFVVELLRPRAHSRRPSLAAIRPLLRGGSRSTC